MPIAFLPPKKKAKKRDLKTAHFLKNGLCYIIIYYYYYYIIKQQNALTCICHFRVNALLHGIFVVCTPKHQAHVVTQNNLSHATQQHYPTNRTTSPLPIAATITIITQ